MEHKTTDYCLLCGESPDSGTHLFDHTYIPPIPPPEAYKYRKKPVIVDAIKVSEALQLFSGNWKDVPKWLEEAYDYGGFVPTPRGIYIKTLEGSMFADINDWIIRGVHGEVYPCKPEIFATTYEKAL